MLENKQKQNLEKKLTSGMRCNVASIAASYKMFVACIHFFVPNFIFFVFLF